MEPLIFTSKGNLPVASLKFETEWDVAEEYIKFTERYRDASGEVVQQSVHVYDKLGVNIPAAAQEF